MLTTGDISKRLSFIEDLAQNSNNTEYFLDELFELLERVSEKRVPDEYTKKARAIIQKSIDLGVRICVYSSHLSYSIIGEQGKEDNQIELSIKSAENMGGAFGIYSSKSNAILMSTSTEEDINNFIESKIDFYGIDRVDFLSNPTIFFVQTLVHEAIHSILHSNMSVNFDNADSLGSVSELRGIISKTGKLNELGYLNPVMSNYQEVISHLCTNRNYVKFLSEKGYQYNISKYIDDVILDSDIKETIIDFIQYNANEIFDIDTSLIYQIPDTEGEKTFLSREFFSSNDGKILGIEIETTNQWGNNVFITKKKKEHKSLLDILSSINEVPEIDFSRVDNLNKLDEYDNIKDVSFAIERVNEAISNNQKNVGVTKFKEVGDAIVSFSESVKMYNIDNGYMTWLEVEAYLYCYPSEKKLNWLGHEGEYTKQQILESKSKIELNYGFPNQCEVECPTVIYDGETEHFFSIYLHGDTTEKRMNIESNKDAIVGERGEDYYDSLINMFDQIKGLGLSFDNEDYDKRPYIHPTTYEANTFMIKTFTGDSRAEELKENANISLSMAFYKSISDSDNYWFKSSKYSGVNRNDIITLLEGKRFVRKPHSENTKDADKKAENQQADADNSEVYNRVFDVVTIAFSDFIKDHIDQESKEALEDKIRSFYNKFTFTDYRKVPVGCTHSRLFKGGIKLRLQEAQREAIAFLNVTKNGLLAYDIGIGKTISTAAHISNRMDSDLCNRALIVTPKSLNEKWYNDLKNHEVPVLDDEGKEIRYYVETGERVVGKPKKGKEIITEKRFMYGVTPHINVINLKGLDKDTIFELKDYTEDEIEKIENAEGQKSLFLNTFDKYINKKGKTLKDAKDNEGEDEEQSDDASSEEEGNPKKETKLNFKIDSKDYQEFINILNEYLKNCDIDILKSYGVTNRDNLDAENLYVIVKNAYSDNTLDPNTAKYLMAYANKIIGGGKINANNFYGELVKERILKSQIVFIYAIMEALLKNSSSLKEYYIYTLGELKEFPEKTIFLLTKEGLGKFGFREDTLNNYSDKLSFLLKGIDDSEEDARGKKKESEYAKFWMKIQAMLSNSVEKARVMFEDFNFDYFTFDEAHYAKNLIPNVTKTDEEQEDIKISGDTSQNVIKGAGEISTLALNTFMASMFVQDKPDSTINLLTATPFTNSPLEIYSMLTLINYKYLSSLGIDSVGKFVGRYIRFKTEISVSGANNITVKSIPAGYNNLHELKKIIYTVMNYKTGDQVKIKRPVKVTVPMYEHSEVYQSLNKNYKDNVEIPIASVVNPTKEQQLIFDALGVYMEDQFDENGVGKIFNRYLRSKEDDYVKKLLYIEDEIDVYNDKVYKLASIIKGYFNVTRKGFMNKISPAIAILKNIAAMKNVSLSPYMFKPYVEFISMPEDEIKPKTVIESSPKLMYVLKSIKGFNDWADERGIERKGFVIYSSIGTRKGTNSPIELLDMIAKYMLDPDNGFGYSKDSIKSSKFRNRFSEVELLTGKVTNNNKTTAILDEFNSGNIKCVITTKKEGIDLNENTIASFNISVDWNPTDAKQIEGRSWRQGNKNAYTIVAYPLTANSSDAILYQKLQDKTLRIKDLWDLDSENWKSQFDLGEFDPKELKTSIINRVDKLAPMLYADEVKAKEMEYNRLKAKRDEDALVINGYRDFNNYEGDIRRSLMFWSRLGGMVARENYINEYKKELRELETSIDVLQSRIDESEQEAPSYDDKVKAQQDLKEYRDVLSDISSMVGTYMVEGDDEKVKEAQKSIKDVKEKISKKEEDIQEIEKTIKEEVGDVVKGIKDEMKKDIKRKKEIEKRINDYPKIKEDDPETDVEIADLNSINEGNYFVKSESGSIIYKESGKKLHDIDWVNKATLFDIKEGIERINEHYISTKPYGKEILRYRQSINEDINIRELAQSNDNCLLQGEKPILNDAMYSFNGNADSYYINGYKISNVYTTTTNYMKEYNDFRKWYSIGVLRFNFIIMIRSLKEYKALADDRDPDTYLRELTEQIEELGKEVEGITSTSIPEEIIEKYLDKAFNVINSRRKGFADYHPRVKEFLQLAFIQDIPYGNASEIDKAEKVEYVSDDFEVETQADDIIEIGSNEIVEAEIIEDEQYVDEDDYEVPTSEDAEFLIMSLETGLSYEEDESKKESIKETIELLRLGLEEYAI